jgi:hypothetical protein
MPRYVIEDNTVVAKRNLILNRTTWKNFAFGLCPSSNVFKKTSEDGQSPKTWFFQVQYTIVRTL